MLKNVKVALGILSILTGLIYMLRLYGPTESEVATWGLIAAFLGGMVVYLALNPGKNSDINLKAVVVFLSVIQIPPIYLWFIFTGSGISDGTPQSPFVAHWLYSLPHVLIVLVGLFILFSPINKEKYEENAGK